MPNRIRSMKPEAASLVVDAAFDAWVRAQGQPRDTGPATLADFAHIMDPDYEDSPVTDLICGELEALEQGENNRLILMVPPREGKTTHVSRFFPAWYLGRHPKHQVILGSYNDDLAETNSRHVRDLFESDRWPYPDVALRSDMRSVGHWETNHGGVVRATGVQGGATGYGSNLLAVDDYCKSKQEADSETIRELVWGWWQTVASTRRMAGCKFIICATRWHEDDLIGRVLNSRGASQWRVVEIPMIARGPGEYIGGGDDRLGRSKGEFLNGRIPQAEVPKVDLDEISQRDFAALYQQRPTTEQGNLFKRDKWRTYNPDEEYVKPLFVTVDSAFKTTVASDYSAAAVWGKVGNRAYCLGAWSERVEFPELVDRLSMIWEEHHVPLVIEDKGSGQSAAQVLQRLGIPVQAFRIPRYATKEQRADEVTPWVNSAAVYLADDEHWWSLRSTVTREEFIEQHAAFPHAAHDDLVDTTSIALSQLFAHAKVQRSGDLASRWSTYKVGTAAVSSPERSIAADLFGASR